MARFQKTAMHLLGGMATVVLVASASAGQAQDARRLSVDLPAQRLGESLRALALLSGRTILADATLVANRQAPAVRGSYTIEEALALVLASSGLAVERVGDSFVVRSAAGHSDPQTVGEGIVVTGTRIRGAASVGSNVVTLDREDIDRSG